MSSKCPHCGSEVDKYSPAVVGDCLSEFADWDDFESDNLSYGYPEGKVFLVSGLGNVKIVKKKTEYEGKAFVDAYDGYPQGTEFDTFIIFEVAGRFYRKEGTGNSYGNVEWGGPFREVKPTTKTITVYEFDN